MLFATLRTSFSRGALNRLQNCDVRNLLCVSRNCSNLNKGIPKGGIEVDPQKLLLNDEILSLPIDASVKSTLASSKDPNGRIINTDLPLTSSFSVTSTNQLSPPPPPLLPIEEHLHSPLPHDPTINVSEVHSTVNQTIPTHSSPHVATTFDSINTAAHIITSSTKYYTDIASSVSIIIII